jgi:RHS repeat-associated protein
LQQVDYSGATTRTITYTNDILGLVQVLAADDGTDQTRYLFGLDLIYQDDDTETRYLLADGLGSVRTELVSDTVETVTTYSPYGNLLARSGSSGTIYGFTGEQYDDATNLLYLRARHFNPVLRVFLTRDPYPGNFRLPSTLHGYVYAGNNPTNLVDPTGYKQWRTAKSSGERAVEWIYERIDPAHIHLEFDRMLGYPSLINPRVDILNSLTGDVYEIEPWVPKGPAAVVEGIAQAQGYEFLLEFFGGGGTFGPIRITGAFRLPAADPNDWNLVSRHLGAASRFPPIIHRGPMPVIRHPQRQPIPAGFDFIAVSPVDGVVVWWLQPNPTITAAAFEAALVPQLENNEGFGMLV